MSNYTPRPGSKTAAAVDYLRANGGAAKFIDIAEAADTERKNLPATLKSAIDNGLIEACDLPDGKGYRLCDAVDDPAAPTLDEALTKIRRDDGDNPTTVATLTDSVTTLPAPVTTSPKKAKRAATLKKSLPAATSLEAAQENWQTEIRPYLGKMPKAPAGKPRARSATAADHFSGTAKMVSLRKPQAAPPPENKTARIGHFSDGSVCIEGPDDLVKITDDYDANRVSVMLSPEVALQLVRFIGAGE